MHDVLFARQGRELQPPERWWTVIVRLVSHLIAPGATPLADDAIWPVLRDYPYGPAERLAGHWK